MTCPSCGASVASGALLCPRCCVALSPPVHSSSGPSATTPVGSPPVISEGTAPSAPTEQAPRPALSDLPPLAQHSDMSLLDLKVGIGLQVAAAVAFIVSIIMDSYSVTKYYYSGSVATTNPLLVPGIFLGAVALVLAAIGTLVSRRSKAKRLTRFTSRRR